MKNEKRSKITAVIFKAVKITVFSLLIIGITLFGLYLDSLLNLDRAEGYYEFDVLQVPLDRYIVNLGTSKLINYAHKNNIAVHYWTINDKKKMSFLQSIGADGIITDIPDVAYGVLR